MDGTCDVPGCTNETYMGWRPLSEPRGKQVCEYHFRRHDDPTDSFNLWDAFGFRRPAGTAKPTRKPVQPPKAEPHFTKEAKKRQQVCKGSQPGATVPKLAQLKARDEAASAFNVSHGYISAAKKLKATPRAKGTKGQLKGSKDGGVSGGHIVSPPEEGLPTYEDLGITKREASCRKCGGQREPGHTYCRSCAAERKAESNRRRRMRAYRKKRECSAFVSDLAGPGPQSVSLDSIHWHKRGATPGLFWRMRVTLRANTGKTRKCQKEGG